MIFADMSQKLTRILPLTTSVLAWPLAGLLLGLAFVHPLTWWLGIFGVWFLVSVVVLTANVQRVIVGTLAMGSVYYGLVVVWLWNVYPVATLSASATYQLLGIGVIWLLTVAALTLGKLFLTLPLYYWKQRINPLTVAGLWVGSDLVGAFFYCVMSFGPGAILNARFSFGWPGYLLAEHALLLPLSAIGGVFLLSFIFLLSALVARRLWERKPVYALLFLIVFIVTAWWPIPERAPEPVVGVAALQTQFVTYDSSSRERQQKVLTSAITAAIADGNSYVILPEGANFAQFFEDDTAVLSYLDTLGGDDVVLVDSGWVKQTNGQSFFRARLYDTKTMRVYQLDKQYLVPQGEFMSYLFSTLLQATGFSAAAKQPETFYSGVPGTQKWELDWPAYLPGVLFCFESIDPWGARRVARSRSVPFVAHIISHAWFHEPHVLWHQLDQMLKVNTRFAGVPLYQAANMHEAKQY
jgi:hypothetical protein